MSPKDQRVRQDVLKLVYYSLAERMGIVPLAIVTDGDRPTITFGVQSRQTMSIEHEDELRWILSAHDVEFVEFGGEDFESALKQEYRCVEAYVRQCGSGFKKCPMDWENFSAGDRPKVRHCQVCAEDVYLARSLEEMETRCQAGQCVALANFDDPRDFICGETTQVESPTEQDGADQPAAAASSKFQ